MERRMSKLLRAVLFGSAMLSFIACNEESAVTGKGEVDFEITDAPSDDANIKSVMVTVAEIKVNGKAIPGFTKQTIDLMAYQEGSTKLLGTAQLDSKAYSSLTLVLELNNDAFGSAPGCYVKTVDGTKYKLQSTASGMAEVVVNDSWNVTSGTKNRIVMDFDLRKSIRYSDDPSMKYSFVSESNLNSAVRLVSKEKSGTIKGTYQEESSVDSEKIIVYAYRKGTFNASTETEGQTADNIFFKNAVASAEVKQTLTGKTFTLAFLEEGEYELHFYAYDQDSATGRFTVTARLQSENNVDGQVKNIISVKAGASVNITTTIRGVFSS